MIPPLVLDNSVSAAWCFSDESNDYTEGVFSAIETHGRGIAPALWPLELANSLVVAERKKRVTAEKRNIFLASLAELDIEVELQATERIFTTAIELATTHGLSVYDAAYLELALRRQLPLASQDQALIRAATQAGISIFQP